MPCTICTEEIRPLNLFSVKPCFHSFCNDCISHYVKAKLDDNSLTIKCPSPNCKLRFLDPDSCRKIIPLCLFDRWGMGLCEKTLGKKKFYCPYNDCSALLMDEKVERNRNAHGKKWGIGWLFCMAIRPSKITRSQCPACNRNFCVQCRVPWHVSMQCEQYQTHKFSIQRKEEEDQEKLRQMAVKEKWQKCPSCNIYVEKIDGCKFIECRCGYCFCYVCATQMSKRTHYCTKCKG